MSTSASWNPLDQKSRQIAAVRQSLSLHTAQQTGQEGRESKKTVTRIAYGHTRHTYFCPFIVKTRSRVLNLFLISFQIRKKSRRFILTEFCHDFTLFWSKLNEANSPSLNTQSCNRRHLFSTFRFENLSISPKKNCFFNFFRNPVPPKVPYCRTGYLDLANLDTISIGKILDQSFHRL